MTVRHPFERILSAYRDKFYVLADTPNEKNKAAKFFRLYGNKIIHKYRSKEDTTAQSPKYEHWTTFTFRSHWPLRSVEILFLCNLKFWVIKLNYSQSTRWNFSEWIAKDLRISDLVGILVNLSIPITLNNPIFLK